MMYSPRGNVDQRQKRIALRLQMPEEVSQEETVPDKPVAPRPQEGKILQEVDLSPLEALAGFVGACVADAESGMVVLSIGEFDFELAAAMNAEVLKAKRRAVRGLRLDDEIEDILISLGKQYHLIRPLAAEQSLFTYLVLDRTQASLGLARVALRNLERQDA